MQLAGVLNGMLASQQEPLIVKANLEALVGQAALDTKEMMNSGNNVSYNAKGIFSVV
jgi:hypothetical protein